MSRYARRTDRNHREILDAAERLGAVVRDVHALPGMLDAWIGWRGRWIHVEIKDGTLPPSARKLTPSEEQTINRERAAGLPVEVVTGIADLYEVLGIAPWDAAMPEELRALGRKLRGEE